MFCAVEQNLLKNKQTAMVIFSDILQYDLRTTVDQNTFYACVYDSGVSRNSKGAKKNQRE